MMIGTPTASSLWPAYLLTVFSVVAGFAVYDILYRRVPDRALAFLCPSPLWLRCSRSVSLGTAGSSGPPLPRLWRGPCLAFASLWLLPWQRVELGLGEATLNSVGYSG